MNYQEIIDKCKQTYKEHNLKLAYYYWEKLYNTFDKKLEKVNCEEEKAKLYNEYFRYMEQFTNNEVYDITDYGKEQAYMQMEKDKYNYISLNNLSGNYDLGILEDFCDFYEWRPVKTNNGFNIFDLQLSKLVEEEDYKTFDELVNRIVGRAIDYFSDEQDWNEKDEDDISYGLELYKIAKKYTDGTKQEKNWLDNFKKDLNKSYLEQVI